MIFKKTILALSLSVVSVIAAAAPVAPASAPAAAAPVNVLKGAPAYVMTAGPLGFTAYTPLSDNDHIQRGGIPQGAWTGQTMSTQTYVIDFSGAPCVDKYGSCAAKPGKGATDVNTVVVYFEQPIGAEVDPSDTTLLGDERTFTFSLAGYDGTAAGVSMSSVFNKADPGWHSLGPVVERNNLVKRTITFPTQKFSKLAVTVNHDIRRGDYWRPTVVDVQAFNLPVAAVKP